MVHRALLAAGPALTRHASLLGLVHRELFPAMAAAVGPRFFVAACFPFALLGRLLAPAVVPGNGGSGGAFLFCFAGMVSA
jgi:hypothetical protein